MTSNRRRFLQLHGEGLLIKEAAPLEPNVSFSDLMSGRNALFLTAPLVLGGMAAGYGKLRGYLEDRDRDQRQKQAFAKAMELFPDLKTEDRTKVNAIWASIIHTAPEVATDPAVLGTVLRSLLRGYTDLNVSAVDLQPLLDLEMGMRGQKERRKPAPGILESLETPFKRLETLQTGIQTPPIVNTLGDIGRGQRALTPAGPPAPRRGRGP